MNNKLAKAKKMLELNTTTKSPLLEKMFSKIPEVKVKIPNLPDIEMPNNKKQLIENKRRMMENRVANAKRKSLKFIQNSSNKIKTRYKEKISDLSEKTKKKTKNVKDKVEDKAEDLYVLGLIYMEQLKKKLEKKTGKKKEKTKKRKKKKKKKTKKIN